MASAYTPPVQSLIDELGRLPGIGPKSAQRIAFHLLKVSPDDANRLAHAIREAKEKVRFCERCSQVCDSGCRRAALREQATLHQVWLGMRA